MPTEKILVINVRPQNVGDFQRITQRIKQRAPDIGVLCRPGDFQPGMVPWHLQGLPRLSVYLVNAPLQLHEGTILSVCRISKQEQARGFEQAGVDTPRTQAYLPGTVLDSQVWGTHVILKAEGESFGRGVMLCPVESLNALSADSLPADHPLCKRPYLVQQFIDTGEFLEKFRLTFFMGELLLSYRGVYGRLHHLPRSLNEALEAQTFVSDARMRYTLECTDELEAFGRRMFNVFPDQPIQGLDILRSARDGRLYAIENNAGGNVWKFSDEQSLPYKVFGPQRLARQFKAWDRAADALIRQTRELAS
jgi:hypothetical protein